MEKALGRLQSQSEGSKARVAQAHPGLQTQRAPSPPLPIPTRTLCPSRVLGIHWAQLKKNKNKTKTGRRLPGSLCALASERSRKEKGGAGPVPRAGPRASRSGRHGGSALASPPPGLSAILSITPASPSPSRTPRSSFPPCRPGACRRCPGSRGWSARRPSAAPPAPERLRGRRASVPAPLRCCRGSFLPTWRPFILPEPGARGRGLLPEKSRRPLHSSRPSLQAPCAPGKPSTRLGRGSSEPCAPGPPPIPWRLCGLGPGPPPNPIASLRPRPGLPRARPRPPLPAPSPVGCTPLPAPPTFPSRGPGHPRGARGLRWGGGEVTQPPANRPAVSELREEKRWEAKWGRFCTTRTQPARDQTKPGRTEGVRPA